MVVHFIFFLWVYLLGLPTFKRLATLYNHYFSFIATQHVVRLCISKFPLVALPSSALENIPAIGTFQTFFTPSISVFISGPNATILPAQLNTIKASASGISTAFISLVLRITFSITSKSGGSENRTLAPCGTVPLQKKEWSLQSTLRPGRITGSPVSRCSCNGKLVANSIIKFSLSGETFSMPPYLAVISNAGILSTVKTWLPSLLVTVFSVPTALHPQLDLS